MRLEGDVYCEGPECEHHWHAGLSRFDGRTIVSFPPGWMVVSEHVHNGPAREFSFCDADCLMKWSAAFEPPERIDL